MLTGHFKQVLDNSILKLLFDVDEMNQLMGRLQPIHARAGEKIITEGEMPQSCIIVLSGEVSLFSDVDGAELNSGSVTTGRSINTYSVLRNMAYQYSACFRSEGEYVSIPQDVFQKALQDNKAVAQYLLAMTESAEYRVLAKELSNLGCSSDFKIAFISGLEMRQCKPQEWLVVANEQFNEAFYILDGKVISQPVAGDNKATHKQPLMPTRVWIGWKNVINKSECQTVIKAVSLSKILVIKKETIAELREAFAEDFDIFHNSVVNGRSLDIEEESSEDEDIDLNEIIAKTSHKRFFWQSYPWIQQNDMMDCGPACMAMISQYYGHKVSIQFWRSQLSTNKEGTSLFDLAKTAERCGFTSHALSAESLKDFDVEYFPVIALRKYHYIVVYKVTANHVIVGDPAVGIKRMTLEEFNKGFEQAVLFLRPNQSFFNLPKAQGQYSHFFQLLKGFEYEMSLSFVISLMIVALGLITPIFSQIFMDDILVRRDLSLLKIALATTTLVAVLSGFLNWARNYYSNYLATKFDFRSHSLFLKKMLSLDYKFFADRHVGDFTQRLSELDKAKSFLLNTFEKLIISFVSLVIYSVALIVYSPKIAVAVFATAPLFFIISWLSGKTLSKMYQKIFTERAEISSGLTDTIKGISAIKSLGAELSSRWRYEEKLVGLLKESRKFSLTASSIAVFAGFYSQFVNALIMGLAAYLAINGDLTPGQVVAVTMIAGNILAPMTAIASKFGEIQEIKAVFNRLNDVLLAPSEKISNKGRIRKDNLRGDIEFKDVWFKYGGDGSDWVLKGISFKIEAGSKVAIVGPSGSGKSTLAYLLTRMYEPTQGQIFIDDRDFLDYDIDWLRAQIGILHQESNLFHGSIAENIAYSESEIDLSKVSLAAQQAAADEFIQKKSGTYDYLLTGGGLGLSGGEKQRIALARTFYRKPQIMVLDEATSALDGIAESKLMKNISSTVKNSTILNIAHRYSTVKYSESVLVLSGGKVVGFGSHEQLVRDNEVYNDLFSQQTDLKQKASVDLLRGAG